MAEDAPPVSRLARFTVWLVQASGPDRFVAMSALTGTTSCSVAIARRRGGLSARGDVVARIGEELFLDEQLRSLSGGRVATA